MIKKYLKWHIQGLNTLYIRLSCMFKGQFFCLLFNIRAFVRRKNVRFVFSKSDNTYKAISEKYVRKFVERYQNFITYSDGIEDRGLSLGNVYQLNIIDFKHNDVVIDCGANVGDLQIYFQEKKLNLRYIAIEPSPKEFFCLRQNIAPSEAYNCGLWHEHGDLKFYVSSRFGDSSFFEPTSFTEILKIPTERLDSIIGGKIKLLKIEAEGAEPEVLKGAEKILESVEYISADLGFERGLSQESTLAPVVNFLLQRNFEVIGFSSPRIVILFRNKNSFYRK